MGSTNAKNRDRIKKSFNGLGYMPAGLDPLMGQLCHQIADKARQLAPKDTGELAGSIEVQVPGQFNRFSGNHNRFWSVVVNSDHAAAVEYGTRNMVAQPFFRPAIGLSKTKIGAFVTEAVRTAVRRARRSST